MSRFDIGEKFFKIYVFNANIFFRLWRAIADEEKKRRDRSPILSFFGEYENLWTDLIPRKPFIDNLRVPPMLALNFSNPFSRSCMEEVVKGKFNNFIYNVKKIRLKFNVQF